MEENKQKCQTCGNVLVKNGTTSNGKQRYLCKFCTASKSRYKTFSEDKIFVPFTPSHSDQSNNRTGYTVKRQNKDDYKVFQVVLPGVSVPLNITLERGEKAQYNFNVHVYVSNNITKNKYVEIMQQEFQHPGNHTITIPCDKLSDEPPTNKIKLSVGNSSVEYCICVANPKDSESLRMLIAYELMTCYIENYTGNSNLVEGYKKLLNNPDTRNFDNVHWKKR